MNSNKYSTYFTHNASYFTEFTNHLKLNDIFTKSYKKFKNIYEITFKRNFKRTSLLIEWHVRFTTASLKALSDEI